MNFGYQIFNNRADRSVPQNRLASWILKSLALIACLLVTVRSAAQSEYLRVVPDPKTQLRKAHPRMFAPMGFSDDGLLIAWSIDSPQGIAVWSGVEERIVQFVPTDTAVYHILVDRGNSRFFLIYPKGGVSAWNILSGKKIWERQFRRESPGKYPTSSDDEGISSFALAPDCSQIALGFGDHSILILDAHNGGSMFRIREAHAGRPTSLVFLQSGGVIASVSSVDDHVSLWDTSAGSRLTSVSLGSQESRSLVKVSEHELILISHNSGLVSRIHYDTNATIRSSRYLSPCLHKAATESSDGRIAVGTCNGTLILDNLTPVLELPSILGPYIWNDSIMCGIGFEREFVCLDPETFAILGILELFQSDGRWIFMTTDGRYTSSPHTVQSLRLSEPHGIPISWTNLLRLEPSIYLPLLDGKSQKSLAASEDSYEPGGACIDFDLVADSFRSFVLSNPEEWRCIPPPFHISHDTTTVDARTLDQNLGL